MANAQDYTVSHTGSVLGADMVTATQNVADSQSDILAFECPRKFSRIAYAGRRDATRFVPRSMETVTGTTGDDTVVSLETDLQPVAGEEDIEEQDYPVAVAYNVDQAAEVDIESVDYAANTVTLATDPADTETVKVYPVISEGSLQMFAVNQFNQVEGPVYPWPTPITRWSDFHQDKRGLEINLHGSLDYSEAEKLVVRIESPRQIVWEDSDYPRGEFVSTFEQDVKIHL